MIQIRKIQKEVQRIQNDYLKGICNVQDYIDYHINEPITVDHLSEISGFSKYHFSRIFHTIRKEAPMHYTNRIRVERAKFYLAHRKDKNITQIAFLLGFSDSSVFSRTFKAYCKISPNEYRKIYSKNCNESYLLSDYNKKIANTKGKKKEQALRTTSVTVEYLKESNLVYVRHTGTYETLADRYANMVQILEKEALEQNLLEKDSWILAIYHDNPEFSLQEQFRTSLCIRVSNQKEMIQTKNLGMMKLEGGLYAVGHFKIRQEQYPAAWNEMYQIWIKSSKYRPRNSYPFEVYKNDPTQDPNGIHIVDIYVPIETVSD